MDDILRTWLCNFPLANNIDYGQSKLKRPVKRITRSDSVKPMKGYLKIRTLVDEYIAKKVRDMMTVNQVQASKLPSIYADMILECSRDKWRAYYELVQAREMEQIDLEEGFRFQIDYPFIDQEPTQKAKAEIAKMEQMHTKLVGSFIVKLRVLLRSGSVMKAEVVERMYNAEFEEMLLKVEVEEEGMTAQQESAQVALSLYAVVVSAVSLLLFVYQYLIGHIDKGGTLTCSSGSFQFRATFVSIVLFEGAYVWIKFRDVAPSSTSTRGGYRRPVKDKLSGTIKLSKPEARYTPPGQSGNHIYLGVCDDDHEVQSKKKIAAFYYGRDEGRLDLGDGSYFPIPSMPRELEQSLCVKGKRKWVSDKVREVFEEFKKELKAIHSGTVHRDEQINAAYDHPSHFEINGRAEQFPRSSEAPLDASFDSKFGGEAYSSGDIADFCMFLEEFLVKSPSDMPDGQPQQHVQANQVQDLAMVGSTFAPLGINASSSEGSLNVPATSSIELDVGALAVEHCTPHDVQACEFPTISQDALLCPQQGSDVAMPVISDMRTPSVTNVCLPNSTSGDHQDVLHSEPAGTNWFASGEILNVLPERIAVATATSSEAPDVDASICHGSTQQDSEACQFPITRSSIQISPRSDFAEAVVLMDDRDQRLQELWQAMQEKDQTIQEMKQLAEAKDRKIFELELEILRLRRTSQHVL